MAARRDLLLAVPAPAPTNPWIVGDGIFMGNLAYPDPEAITDGTSNTIAAGETSRFKNDPDAEFNTWSRALFFGSSVHPPTQYRFWHTSSRGRGLASELLRINAPVPARQLPGHSQRLPNG